MRKVINQTGGGSLCVKTNYYKMSLANFIHKGGDSMLANAVIEINEISGKQIPRSITDDKGKLLQGESVQLPAHRQQGCGGGNDD